MASKAAIVELVNKILKILNGSRLPLFQVSILYVMYAFLLVLDSSLVDITEVKVPDIY